MKTVMFFYYFFTTLTILSFCLKWKNLIGLLLTLEMFMLCFMMFLISNNFFLNIFYMVIIILISEAVLGLSLLIMNIRFFGNDFSNNFFW